MPILSQDIGAVFEEWTQERFPEFRREDIFDEGIVPDFHAGNFLIEAKAGFQGWGPRIKKEQVSGFRKLSLPVVYILGYHNFERSRERLEHLSSPRRRAILRRYMGIESAFFVTDSVVRAIWKKERLVSEKGKVEYCQIKPRIITSIMRNSLIERSGSTYRAKKWFGLEGRDLILQSPSNNGRFQYGLILDRRTDKKIIDYLKARDLVK